MAAMFQYCYKLKYLDISNFNTSNVTNFSFMFNKFHNLEEIKGLDKFKTKNAKDMLAMFQECKELKSLDLSNFNTSNVTNMSSIFNKCDKLIYLNLSNFTIKPECKTMEMLSFKRNTEMEFITNNKELKQLYNPSST